MLWEIFEFLGTVENIQTHKDDGIVRSCNLTIHESPIALGCWIFIDLRPHSYFFKFPILPVPRCNCNCSENWNFSNFLILILTFHRAMSPLFRPVCAPFCNPNNFYLYLILISFPLRLVFLPRTAVSPVSHCLYMWSSVQCILFSYFIRFVAQPIFSQTHFPITSNRSSNNRNYGCIASYHLREQKVTKN